MAVAASAVPYVDAPHSLGFGVGHAGGVNAVAMGLSVRINEHSRVTATLMRSSSETGLAVGLAVGW